MFDQFVSWAQEFDNSTLEQKKMIISQLVTRIELNKDYAYKCVIINQNLPL